MANPGQEQWQSVLGGKPGQRVTGLGELQQSLLSICTTEYNSVPGRPGFGLRSDQILDAPLEYARAYATREVVRAVRQGDPRITVLDVVPSAADADGHVTLDVHWQPTGAKPGSAPQVTSVGL